MISQLIRLRRLRNSQKIRNMVAETVITLSDLLYPVFVIEGKNIIKPISSMPGINCFSIDKLVEECKFLVDLGISGIMLFGIPLNKDSFGREAYAESGIIPSTIRIIKEKVPNLILVADVCMCGYTDHGHCGIVKDDIVENDSTIKFLVMAAVAYAKAGVDIVAPSDMMDGRVLEIRRGLDKFGFEHIPIMSYSVKYASFFYSPFRDAVESTPKFGDRKGHQMDFRNTSEALREVFLDINEGADIIMVKPALSYLDIIYRISSSFRFPVAAYNVSGEYAMIKAAAKYGWIDHDRIMMEVLMSIKRAGANIILTYFAKEAAVLLNKGWVY